MDEQKKRAIHQRALAEVSIRQEFEQTLPDRVRRYLQVKHHGIIPNAPFAVPSSECSLLFRDGHYYACIALVQAVTEAIVRYMCDISFGRHSKDIAVNLDRLLKGKWVDNHFGEQVLRIWDKRHDYHHLNATIESDRRILEDLAKEKTCLLVELESRVFAFTVRDGNLIPAHPEYWKIDKGNAQIYLRLEP